MTKRNKTILFSGIIILICVVAAIVAVLWLGKAPSGISHLQTSGVNLTLTRDGLAIKGLNEEGRLTETKNDEKTDFTSATDQNVFGVEANTVIVPGSSYRASMVVAGKNGKPFAYWLEIKLNGELNELSKQLKITVTVEGELARSFYLSEGLMAGNDREPLARVRNGSSSFTVAVEFERDVAGNGDAQGEWAGFDLVVHAVNID